MRARSSARPSSPKRSQVVAALLAGIIVGHILLAWQLRSRGVFTLGDDAAYLLLGRSLRAFSYREVQFVGEPIAARFPPGYPALLAAAGALFGERVNLIAAIGIALSASGIWALFDVVRRRWSPEVGLAAAALVAINPALLEYAGLPVSETTFTTLTLWSLWAADRVGARSSRSSSAPSRGSTARAPEAKMVALAITLAVLAALTRSAGLMLPLALIAHWLWCRRWRAALAAVMATGLFVGSWLAWTTFAPRREVRLSYIDDAVRPAGNQGSLVQVLAGRVASNVPAYATQISLTQLRVPVTPRTIVDNIAWVVVLGTLFLIGLASAWHRWHAAVMYVLAYCSLLAIWTYLLDRFLVPVVPFTLTLIVVGAAVIGERLWSWRRDVGVAMVVAVLAAFALLADAALVGKADDCDRARVDCARAVMLDFVDAAKVARTTTPPSARIVAPKGAALYYHGGRQAVFWEEAIRQDTASFIPYLRAEGVTHILASPVYGDHDTILRLVEHSCSQFELVRAVSPQTLLLAFRGAVVDAATSDRACVAVRRALSMASAVVAGPSPIAPRTSAPRVPELALLLAHAASRP